MQEEKKNIPEAEGKKNVPNADGAENAPKNGEGKMEKPKSGFFKRPKDNKETSTDAKSKVSKGQNPKNTSDKPKKGIIATLFGLSEDEGDQPKTTSTTQTAYPAIPAGEAKKTFEMPKSIPFQDRLNQIPNFKPIKHIDLIVFLLENSNAMLAYKEQVKGVVKKFRGDYDRIYIMSYGKDLDIFMYHRFDEMDYDGFISPDESSDNICFYDAVEKLHEIVDQYYGKIQDSIDGSWSLSKIDVMGIGTGINNGSKVSDEEALQHFKEAVSKSSATTKYLCIKDEYFPNAAVLGFRSIGAIERSF